MNKVLQEKINKIIDNCWENEEYPGSLADILYTQEEIAQMMTNNLYIDEDVKGRQAIVGIGTVAKWIAEGK